MLCIFDSSPLLTAHRKVSCHRGAMIPNILCQLMEKKELTTLFQARQGITAVLQLAAAPVILEKPFQRPTLAVCFQ